MAYPTRVSALRQVDRYVIERELGRGAFGTVFLARHAVTGRAVALKVLHARHAGDVEMVERFFREARAAASTMSPHIVDVLDAGIAADGAPFLALELLDGEDLDAYLSKRGSLRPIEAVRLAKDICAGLEAAHRRGIVHRDLKPANVFLARQPDGSLRAKVLDFGMSKLAEPEPGASARTGTGAIMGTPLYMAPEQLRGGARDVDARADLYALGAILYRMLSGRLPYEAASLEALLAVKLTEPPRELGTVVPGLPPALLELVGRCLASTPSERPATAAEIEATLGEIERALAAPTPSPSTIVPAPPQDTSARWVIAGLGAGLLAMTCVSSAAMLGAGGAVWAYLGRPVEATPQTTPIAPIASPTAPTPTPPAAVPWDPSAVSAEPAGPLGVHVSVTALGRGVTETERAIADRAVSALARCRTAHPEHETLQFVWLDSANLHYSPSPSGIETPVRACMRRTLVDAARGASANGIVRFEIMLDPR